ncbi:diaminopimelate epimerase [Blattabacterium cuenoti]|uniref:diaminopimelate epimerase n=1 Tax=Blattabacterium cuenoti TaxID=1653831 RepID=UPI00163CEBDB|nr:diaminopimelate epimerase [Blattabacterium cuenoti]
MKLNFFKYQGTGNDFIMLDFREKNITESTLLFKTLCDRNFGIGADGVISIQNDENFDFYMKYYNSDGKESTMCGNGGRCVIFFSKQLGIIKDNKTYFRAEDGPHYGFIKENNLVSIKLKNLKKTDIVIHLEHIFLNTGSPHCVLFVENLHKIDVYKEGRKIRFNNPYLKKGVNVNFVKILEKNILHVRTYERGVEKETLSCGTGVAAAVIAAYETNKISYKDKTKIPIKTTGGSLLLSLKKTEEEYRDIYLTGPAEFVFKGSILI